MIARRADADVKAAWALVSRHGLSFPVAVALVWLYDRQTAGWKPIVEVAGGGRRSFRNTVRPLLIRGLIVECRQSFYRNGRRALGRWRVEPGVRAEIRELVS